MLEQQVQAAAKVNLYLRVLGRRPDGYHDLDSLMVPVGLYDQLRIRVGPPAEFAQPQPRITLTSDSPGAPSDPTNLAHRAAARLLSHLGQDVNVEIHLRKRIPIGSGLGGGSSDAAAVLVTVNRLLGCPLQTAELASLGAELGADVPFFVYGRPAQVGGRGENVTPMQWNPSLPLVVCSDGFVLATRLVYSLLDVSLTTERRASSIGPLVSGSEPISSMLVNDLETAAAKVHPEVLSLKARLVEHGALGALMTGSGSAVFGIWPDLELAERAAEQLRRQGLWAEAAQTLDESLAVAS